MSDEIMQPPDDEMEITGEPMNMFDTWIKAITSPSEATYKMIISDPLMSAGKAYGWFALSTAIGIGIFSILNVLIGVVGSGSMEALGGMLLSLVFAVPIGIVATLLAVTIGTGISTGVAKLLGGEGDFTKLLYATAAYGAPLGLVSNILGAIPFINLLVFPISLYGLVLNVIAVKATHKFDWGRAVASSVLIYIVLLACISVCVIIFLTIMGPTIGNVFENIIMELEP